MIKKAGRHLSPLCFLPNGNLTCYQFGTVIILKDGTIQKKISIFKNIKEKLFGRIGILYRLCRLGVRNAIAIGDNHIIISIGNMLYEMDVEKECISEGFFCGEGIRPLLLSELKGVRGFDDTIVFGGYLGNMDKKPVKIYCRKDIDNWDVVHTFPQGAINHVHNIVADPFRSCLWAFTGDFDEASAIWKISDNFKKVERVFCNDQKYRGCVAYALPEGLLYATDAPFADDYIYLLNPETKECKEIFPIAGSCIYGCRWKDKFVFSSTVEGDGRNTSRIEFYFGRKRGAGVKDNYVHMYMGNLTEGFREIYKEEKDCMPFFTFQFGVFKFPYGVNNTDTLYFHPIATKKNDLCLMAYKE